MIVVVVAAIVVICAALLLCSVCGLWGGAACQKGNTCSCVKFVFEHFQFPYRHMFPRSGWCFINFVVCDIHCYIVVAALLGREM